MSFYSSLSNRLFPLQWLHKYRLSRWVPLIILCKRPHAEPPTRRYGSPQPTHLQRNSPGCVQLPLDADSRCAKGVCITSGNGNRLRANCEFHQFRRAAANGIGHNAEFFDRKAESVRPIGLVAEPFRPGGIPAAKGGEEDLLFWQLKQANRAFLNKV